MSMDFNSSDFQSSPGSMAWLVKWNRRDTKSRQPRWMKLRTGVAVVALMFGAAVVMDPILPGPSKARSPAPQTRTEPVRAIPLTAAENAALFSPKITPQVPAVRVAQAAPVDTPDQSVQNQPSPDQPAQDQPAQVQASPADGLAILSQSWRRGGLGSNAQVTFTLRNNNDYPVKDVEISCAFTQRDGSHLTDRSRTISDVINTKSKKTFVRMHVGFVNVFADKVKCLPVGADKV